MSVSEILTPFAGLGPVAVQCTGVSMYGDGTNPQAVSCQARLSNDGAAATLLASQHAVPANDCTLTLNPFLTPHCELAIGGVPKLTVEPTAIVASVPVLMGASPAQVGQATLDGTGALAVALSAITANAIVMVSYLGGAAGTLPLAVELQANTGFTVRGDANADFAYFIAAY